VAVSVAALVMSLSVAMAEGTFSGRNGQIVFDSDVADPRSPGLLHQRVS